MNALRAVLASKPTLISSAIRSTLLAGGGLGLGWSGTTIAAVMLAVEGWLAVAQALATVPKAIADEREAAAAEKGGADAEERLRSLARAKRQARK